MAPWRARAHTADRVVRACSQLHQEAGRDGPGAAQAPLAMDEHVEPQAQPVPDRLACLRPLLVEVGLRRHPVRYRQVPPLHVPVAHRLAETTHLQVVDFLLCDQADHCGRAPVPNHIQVGVQVARPRRPHSVRIGLAGTQRDADPALAVPWTHRVNAEWIGLAGSCPHGEIRSGCRRLNRYAKASGACRRWRAKPWSGTAIRLGTHGGWGLTP